MAGVKDQVAIESQCAPAFCDPSSSVDSPLFEQPVNLDFASRTEIDAPVRDDRDDETRGHRRAIALAVLF